METDGAIEGSTLELSRYGPDRELSAFLTGWRHDQRVTFTKAYDAPTWLRADPIAYTGLVYDERTRVQGAWRLVSPDPLQGGFVMRRISLSHAFGLRVARHAIGPFGMSNPELRARQEAIRQRRRQITVEKPRRRRPRPDTS